MSIFERLQNIEMLMLINNAENWKGEKIQHISNNKYNNT